MDPKLALELGVLIVTVVANVTATRMTVATLKDTVKDQSERLTELEKAGASRALQAAEALHSRVDKLGESVIRLEGDGRRLAELLEVHSRNIEAAMARVEAQLQQMQARIEVIGARRRASEDTP